MPLSLGSALQDALESSMAWRVFHFIQCSYILEGDLQYYPYKPPVPYNYMKIHFLNLVPSCKSVGKRLQRQTSVRSLSVFGSSGRAPLTRKKSTIAQTARPGSRATFGRI